MAEPEKVLSTFVRAARKEEGKDQRKYQNAYEKSGDPLFKEIADDESRHQRKLSAFLRKRNQSRKR